jgi:hypothetical protein
MNHYVEKHLWFTAQNVERETRTMPRIVRNAALLCTLQKRLGENDTKMSVGENGELVNPTIEWNMSASAFPEEARL